MADAGLGSLRMGLGSLEWVWGASEWVWGALECVWGALARVWGGTGSSWGASHGIYQHSLNTPGPEEALPVRIKYPQSHRGGGPRWA